VTDTALADLVRRWIEEVLQSPLDRPRDPELLGRLAHDDLVMEMHGAGANDDGTPHVMEGLDAASAWFEQRKARHHSPVDVRILRLLTDGDTAAALTEQVWTLHGDDGAPRRQVQTFAGFYTVRDGKIARIVRFTDRVGRPQT
jgi:ketosteroid isomerase-like protein